MNDPVNPSKAEESQANAPPPQERFLEREDWLAFALSALLSLSVYVYTLSPSVELGFSGTLITGARYLGIPYVPGYPLWTIYAWLFSVLLPVSNIAWRMSVASAVAAALVCGITALMTSRYAGDILRSHRTQSLRDGETKAVRLVCATVAGLALAFDVPFWRQAVIAGTWTFSQLLFASSLGFFLRWQFTPARTRYFHAAVFMYAVTLTNSQAFAPAALGFELLILFTDLTLARDVFATTALVMAVIVCGHRFDFLPGWFSPMMTNTMTEVYEVISSFALLMTVILLFKTRAFFTRWRTGLAAMFLFGLGLTPYFLVPIFSMANPPINWGYPRTVEGFAHVLSRGQFEYIHPADTFVRFAECMSGYLREVVSDFGIYYFLAAVIPFFFFHSFQTSSASRSRACSWFIFPSPHSWFCC